MLKILQSAKAIMAFVAAEGAFLTTHGLSAEGHWLTHAVAVVTGILVYLVPNAAKKA